MKILVIGFGSIGRQHIRNLKVCDKKFSIALLRKHTKDKDLGDCQALVDHVFFDERQALQWKPEAAVVCNPAPLHIPTAIGCARAGAHLFIEKPLSNSLRGLETLVRECRRRKLTVMVGYLLRFSPGLRAVKKILSQKKVGRVLWMEAVVGHNLKRWRPGRDYRHTVSAHKNLGGGVLWELSHEIDYVTSLGGELKQLSAQVDKLSDLKMDAPDFCELNMEFKNKVRARIHLDMFDHARQRFCRIVGTQGTLVWDLLKNHNVALLREGGAWETIFASTIFDRNQMYVDQFAHFFNCIRRKTVPVVGLKEGRRVVDIVLAAHKSARLQKTVSV